MTAVIAWTYLLHAIYKRSGTDYRHKNREGEPLRTKHGADKHWELEACLNHATCPIDDVTKANLRFLIEIRHEIEHQMTKRIDDTISSKLQACSLNFNTAIKTLFGTEYGLDRELGVALQFSGIQRTQRDQLLRELDLPANLLSAHLAFENDLPDEVIKDPKYAYRVAYVERSVNSRGKADQVIEFIRPDSAEGLEVTRVLLKEAERTKYKPTDIVRLMQEEGHADFSLHRHTLMWTLKIQLTRLASNYALATGIGTTSG